MTRRQKEKGKLAHLWAKAEVADAEATGKAFVLPQDSEADLDPNTYNFKVGAMQVECLYCTEPRRPCTAFSLNMTSS
jgi:hypothetical protein